MFEKFAKLHVLRPHHPVPHAAAANDNNRGALRPGVGRARRFLPLVCRWTNDEQGLTCHWEVDSTGGPNPLLNDKPRPASRSDSQSDSWPGSWPNRPIHKSVVELSCTANARGARSTSRLLQARH
jgi:hypothetical protein